ncbi:MAG: glycoside hydrolase family 1 protein [Spirochaetales bacterium]|nr:glycoside hydrolase family 1 protein [Spirochaetales bacterium]
MSFKLKKNFLMGAATAATQIEGGECGHNWNDWYRQGKITDNSNPARANDHYNRWKEDIDLMAEMRIKIYRFGIEWARICPAEDRVDEEAINHYREEIKYLIKKKMKPLLTIHHFANPMWFENKGGFTNSGNIPVFLKYVKTVIESFGDLVPEYITINEPNVYATQSYYYGLWPPGGKSMLTAYKVMSNMAACHIEAYKMIHEMRKKMGHEDTKVSFALHARIFDPLKPHNSWHRICTYLLDRFFQQAIMEAMTLGVFRWPITKVDTAGKGEYCDFIAINYYTRSTISGFRDGVRKGSPKNDLGWEIYPNGIMRACLNYYRLIRRPIYITENGTCDNNDAFRSLYIHDHLKVLSELDLPVERYYHWCFCDNFEWIEGESARFGLVHVDFETQERTVKKSGEFYKEIIENHGVTDEMYDKFVKDREYHY